LTDAAFSMTTPYADANDMGPVNEAYSASAVCPWGFEHRGIDFFSNRQLVPFQAACKAALEALAGYSGLPAVPDANSKL